MLDVLWKRRALVAITLISVCVSACSAPPIRATHAPRRKSAAVKARKASKASDWTNYQKNDGNNAVIPGRESYAWTFSPHARINGSLAVVKNSVYVDTFGKRLYALDIATGKPRWVATGQGVLMSTPIVYHGLVFVGTGTNKVLKDRGPVTIWGRQGGDYVDAFRTDDGKPVWTFHTVGEDMPTPAIVDGRLIFGNGDMHAYALDYATGRMIWRTRIPGVTTMSATATAPNEAIIIASHGLDYVFSKEATHVLALDPRDGRIRWSAIHGDSDCSPTRYRSTIVCEGTVYEWYGNNQLGLMGKNDIDAYDAQTGRQKWRWVSRIGYFTSVGSNERGIAGMAHNGILYQSVPTRDEVIAIRITDGSILWRFKTAGPVKMSLVIFQSFLIFGDTSGMLYVVNSGDGTIEALRSERLPFTTSSPVIVGRTLLVANFNSVRAIPLNSLGFPISK